MKLATKIPAALVMTFALTVGGGASAQSSCNSGLKVLEAVWGRWGEQLKAKACKDSAECLGNTAKKEALVRDMVAFWNEQAGGSWATIGPRPLLAGGALNDGKVIAGGERLFISQVPLDADKWEIAVTKEGGGAADVMFSVHDGKTCIKGAEVSFSKSDKPGTKKTLKIDKAMGQLGIVKVDAKGASSFDYKFTLVKK